MHQVVFRVLGPLDIRVAGRPIPLHGARQRTIMAVLLLAPNRVVSVSALADAVWHGRPPATARNQIAICISALRKTFKDRAGAGDILVTGHPGYLLHAEGHRIDAVEFEERVTEGREAARRGRPDEASGRFEEALAMWRGPVLEGIPAERVEAEAARLTELRLSAYEEYAGIRLRLGRHRELIGELQSFMRSHPLREQAMAHLMLAQYRAGRRAEALETFRTGSGLLAEELGIDPGPALRELHAAVLADSPRLSAPDPEVTLGEVVPLPGHGERGVRAGFRLGYRDLSPSAARMFRLLGLLRVPDFAAWVGAVLLGIGPAVAEDVIEQLVAAQLLEPFPAVGGRVRYRFQNLLRLFACECALEEETEGERRAAVYRAYGAWLDLAAEAHRRLNPADGGAARARGASFALPAELAEGQLADPAGWFESERACLISLLGALETGAAPRDGRWAVTRRLVAYAEP
ncbi:BTAD domain-containing putative transcriptional regulator [Kitasatospora aureofaciens]|uniref:AfsR/SARP family transcriptional regulator n=1 Tax=Kitasatospora aureofaciens TaxID=1894 RepID=UPI00381CCA44